MSSDPPKENLFERILQRRPSESTTEYPPSRRTSLASPTGTSEKDLPDSGSGSGPGSEIIERLSSNESDSQSNPLTQFQAPSQSQSKYQVSYYQGCDPGVRERPQMLRRQRRNSKLARFREMLRCEEELDEAGRVYAELM